MADQIYRRRIGDRKDGRLLRSISTVQKSMPYFLKKKNSAVISYTDQVEITALEKYMRKKRETTCPDLSLLHIFIAAYVRTVALRPGINRFVSGQKLYTRHKIEVITRIKRAAVSESNEATVKLEFYPADTVEDVYRRMNEKIARIKTGDVETGLESIAMPLGRLPGPLVKFVFWCMNFADYFDWLPDHFLQLSPFHGSVAMSDFTEIGIRPVEKPLSDFGNLPFHISFGAKRNVIELDEEEGLISPAACQYIDYTITMDERICDSYYYSSVFKYLKHHMRHPELLDLPPEHVMDDVF